MRYIIFGAGAIGGAIGARLFQAGCEVVLLCRGAQLEAVRQRGLLFRAAEGTAMLPIPVVGHPRELAFTDDDVVIFTTKTQDTERALADLETSGGASLPIVCCQNGVENERLAARRFARVYGMLAAMPATYLQPGEVSAMSVPRTGVLHAGRYPRGTDALITQVCADLTRATFVSEPDPTIMRLKYRKLLANLGNAIQLITGSEVTDDASRALRDRAVQEALVCYRAAGLDVASDEEYGERVRRHYHLPDDLAGKVITSTWQSVLRGHTTTEVDYLSGEIVLLGALHDAPTPHNSVIRRIAVHLAATGEPPGRYSVEDLLAMIRAEPVAQSAGA